MAIEFIAIRLVVPCCTQMFYFEMCFIPCFCFLSAFPQFCRHPEDPTALVRPIKIARHLIFRHFCQRRQLFCFLPRFLSHAYAASSRFRHFVAYITAHCYSFNLFFAISSLINDDVGLRLSISRYWRSLPLVTCLVAR